MHVRCISLANQAVRFSLKPSIHNAGFPVRTHDPRPGLHQQRCNTRHCQRALSVPEFCERFISGNIQYAIGRTMAALLTEIALEFHPPPPSHPLCCRFGRLEVFTAY